MHPVCWLVELKVLMLNMNSISSITAILLMLDHKTGNEVNKRFIKPNSHREFVPIDVLFVWL